MKDGVIIINKPEGISSFSVVSRVRRLFEVKKAGHTGTLDPMATGVLPVLLERGVKASEYMLTSDKHYRAVMLLGITTDTEDVTGSILSRSDIIPCEEEVLSAVNSMLGESLQTPPMYSALKIGGKKLCDLARAGEVIDREPRAITVHSINASKINEREYSLDIHCSKGTYIRTLIADIGASLGVGAAMKALMRTEASGYSLSDSYTLEELEKMSTEERISKILPVESVFRGVRDLILPPFFARLARCGVEIYLKKISLEANLGERVKLFDENGFFALGEVREFEDGLAIKPIKQFQI